MDNKKDIDLATANMLEGWTDYGSVLGGIAVSESAAESPQDVAPPNLLGPLSTTNAEWLHQQQENDRLHRRTAAQARYRRFRNG